MNPLEITWALRVTIAHSILSASLVVRVRRDSAISLHSRHVKRSVQAARKVGDIDIEGKLLVLIKGVSKM